MVSNSAAYCVASTNTYGADTWMQPFGERYVDKYDPKGKQRIDLIFQNLTTRNN